MKLADRAEAEIEAAVSRCRSEDYTQVALAAVWDRIKEWTKHPDFLTEAEFKQRNDRDVLILSLRDTGCLRVPVLNNIAFLLADEKLRDGAWAIVRDLAADFGEEDPTGMGISLTISIFEIAAEPPEVDSMLELLFSLADAPRTRWAVFAAYENYPWRLRPHAQKYSGGTVTDEDCNDWLCSQGLEKDEYLITNPQPERASALDK